jgi:hypothetical protein
MSAGTFEPVSRLVQRKIGKRISPSCLWRWHAKGLADGARLRVVRIGRGLFTTEEWWEQFVATQQPPTSPTPKTPSASPDELRAAGLLA